MAQDIKLLCVLLAAALLGPATTITPGPTTTTGPATTTTPGPTTTTGPATTTTPGPTTTTGPATTTTPGPTTTTGPATTTTPGPTTTTGPATTTTPGPTTTTGPATTTTPGPTTTTGPATTTTPGPTTTTGPATTTTPGPTTTTGPATTTTPGPTTTTGPATTTTPGPTTTTGPATTTTPGPTTTTGPATTTTPGPTTTTGPATTTTPGPTTTTGPATTTTPGPTTTTGPATTTTPGPTTTTGPATTTTPGPTTTTGPATTTTPGPTTTTGPATTTTPGPTTTTGPATTTTPGPTTTTGPATTTTPVPTTTKLPGPCDRKPCGDGSTCQPRHNKTFVCLCVAGDYNYDTKICESAKVFPGQLALPGLKYVQAMSDMSSEEFQNAAQNINAELEVVFKENDYSKCTLLELRPIKESKFWSRSEDGVEATVEMIFQADADITTGDVITKLNSGTGILENSTFVDSNLCDKKPCDLSTSKCNSGDGSFNCTCLEDFIETNFSDRMCIACPSGKYAVNSKECEDCSFGRSGFNCKETWKLTLVVVGAVFGGLLLITVILLIIFATKSSKKGSKKNKTADTGKHYVSQAPDKKPLVNSNLANSQPAASVNGSANGLSTFANAGVPRIPRASTTNSWDSRTNLEMTQSNSRQNFAPVGRNTRLYDDHDDMNPYAQARPQSSLYGQSRPQINPYAQNRPQVNPYAQSQGHSNPYYTHDDGRRYN